MRFGFYRQVARSRTSKERGVARLLLILSSAVILVAGSTFTGPGIAGSGLAKAASKGASGLPLPRYVSLKSGRVNMRVGPGRDYKVHWMYTKRGLPIEILQEYDNWRKVRDPEGDEGWILQSLLSGKRTALVSPWAREEQGTFISLYPAPDKRSGIRAKLQPGVLAEVEECRGGWCRLDIGEVAGYVKQSALWGVYPDESFE